MYTVDQRDRVVELDDCPSMDGGAPCPRIIADEQDCHLSYYLSDKLVPDAAGRLIAEGEPFAIVTFSSCKAFLFGWPNEDVLHAHPLGERGLYWYGFFEVAESSWIRKLERLNSVHPHHDPDYFSVLRHFIISFHDSTFECLAQSYQFSTFRGLPGELSAELKNRIGER